MLRYNHSYMHINLLSLIDFHNSGDMNSVYYLILFLRFLYVCTYYYGNQLILIS